MLNGAPVVAPLIQHSTFRIQHSTFAVLSRTLQNIEPRIAKKTQTPGASNGGTLAARRRPGGADARECRHFTAGRQKATPPSPVCRPGEPAREDAAVSRPECPQRVDEKTSVFRRTRCAGPAGYARGGGRG